MAQDPDALFGALPEDGVQVAAGVLDEVAEDRRLPGAGIADDFLRGGGEAVAVEAADEVLERRFVPR